VKREPNGANVISVQKRKEVPAKETEKNPHNTTQQNKHALKIPALAQDKVGGKRKFHGQVLQKGSIGTQSR